MAKEIHFRQFGDSYLGILLGMSALLLAVGGCFFLVVYSYLSYQFPAVKTMIDWDNDTSTEIFKEEIKMEEGIKLL